MLELNVGKGRDVIKALDSIGSCVCYTIMAINACMLYVWAVLLRALVRSKVPRQTNNHMSQVIVYLCKWKNHNIYA